MTGGTADRPAARGLLRQRLVEVLLTEGSDIALVTAPAGSGKSTLLAHAAGAAAAPVAWCRTAGEASARAQLHRLHQALSTVSPFPAGPPGDVDDLLAALDRWGPPQVLLVLDDLQDITGTAAGEVLEQLIAARPSGVRLLLGSRRPLAWDRAALLVADRLVEVAGDDLRFRSWEVERLFREVYGEPLTPEAASALAMRTGGWAAGLKLFHLACSGRSLAERSQAVADLGGRSRLVRDYLARNVLADLPDVRRGFLTLTSALGVLRAPLCDTLLGIADSQAMLEALEHDELFTSSDDDGRTFQYHEVLQSYLEVTLERTLGADAAREWYARCGRLLERDDLATAALRAYARAEDWGAVARLVRRSGPDLTTTGTSSWEHLLPPSVRDHDPWLVHGAARRLLRNGQVAEAVAELRRAEALFAEPSARERCRRERLDATVWLPPDAAGHLPAPSAAGHWAVQVRAVTRSSTHDPAKVRSPTAAGLHALLRGHLAVATDLLSSAATDLDRTTAERCAGLLGLALADLGHGGPTPHALARAQHRLEEVALCGEVDGQPALARLARGVLALLPTPAGPCPSELGVVAECDRAGDAWTAAAVRLLEGLAALGLPDPEPAPRLLEDAAARFGRLGAPVLELWARAMLAVTAARSQRSEADVLAREVDCAARELGVRGAQCLAQAVLATCGPPAQRARHARLTAGLAAECGVSEHVVRRLTGLGHADAAVMPATGTATGGPGFEVQVLGGFRLTADGRPIPLAAVRPRARALLRLLCLHADRDVHRESLIDSLWPEASLPAGVHSLQVAVSSLRQAVDALGLPAGEVLVRSGEAYRLALRDQDRADVRDFERHLATAGTAREPAPVAVTALRVALELYTGDLLPEDGPAEWVVSERERLRLAAAQAALDLARLQRDDDVEAALAAARRAVDLDPWQERAWRLLAELHDDLDDQVGAALVRQGHAAVLDDLGLPQGSASEKAVSAATPPAPPRPRRRARA